MAAVNGQYNRTTFASELNRFEWRPFVRNVGGNPAVFMNIDGSVTAVPFEVGPPAAEAWRVHAVRWVVRDVAGITLPTYGVTPGNLAVGIAFLRTSTDTVLANMLAAINVPPAGLLAAVGAAATAQKITAANDWFRANHGGVPLVWITGMTFTINEVSALAAIGNPVFGVTPAGQAPSPPEDLIVEVPFHPHGIRLNGDNGDLLQIVVQDDLSGLNRHHAMALVEMENQTE